MNSLRHKLQSIKAPIVKKIIFILFVLSLLIPSLIAQTSTENSTSPETGNVPATTETAPSDEEQIVSTVKSSSVLFVIKKRQSDRSHTRKTIQQSTLKIFG
ncbi:hypothetical protein LEP1GSC124_1935 [Leptospira interrogans serovar Pyrogenes str. 200701872]|uniref:Uncharacterized protein n=1 Tax=Leptospira interrogans serovar Pyrogenes str. 200701872 TaxID=1193029 RepID=M7A185_LEPIR|nr:hypothetical protein LEP1GSC124_1935 [Leptospira interrogans serovar Pyrogenes str. 200701872]